MVTFLPRALGRRILPAALALLMLTLSGCASRTPGPAPATSPGGSGPEPQPESAVLRVGATPEPWAPIVKKAAEIAAREGVTIELVEFNDYVKPNLALADGEIDANLFQHRPYFDNFKATRGLKIAPASGPLYIVPMAVYSRKVQSLDQVPEGAQVAVPNDPVNQGRALLILADAGLIRLPAGLGAEATVREIADNPRKLQFRELEAFQLPRSLDDVHLAVIPGNVALGAGLSPKKEALFVERDLKTWANIVATREGEEDRREVQVFLQALKSQELRAWLEETYEGAVYPVYED